MGYDARVVAGYWGIGGHAWVVLFLDAKEYIIEATGKKIKRVYPLAQNLSDYHPDYMFNKDFIWVNQGSNLTTKYSGNHWVKFSQFQNLE